MMNTKISKKVSVKQHDQSDCGTACMASVLAYYGPLMPISLIHYVTYKYKIQDKCFGFS